MYTHIITSLGPWHARRSGRRGGGRGGWGTPFSFDAWDYGAHIFRVDLPEVRKEDVEVEVQVEDNNILHISGDRVVEKEEENDEWHRCGLQRGVLSVEVPKMEVQETPSNVRYIDVA
ncbi:hypothetical protein CDL12_01966 [Handroanthus impetiginosus]|uniref:SHSP domain-containing protein n=1 Tax=Handroanthus impetiginosus TaxID=429701 RepID=A0A2G9I6A2_9LAMI|nr:hypothetical protein CDL12_01966 [Handroanthus impetiginosus]